MPPEKRQRASAATAFCQFCQKPFGRQGLSTHEKACRKKTEAQQRDADVRPETVRKIAERLSESANAQAEVARAALESLLSRAVAEQSRIPCQRDNTVDWLVEELAMADMKGCS